MPSVASATDTRWLASAEGEVASVTVTSMPCVAQGRGLRVVRTGQHGRGVGEQAPGLGGEQPRRNPR